MIPDPRYSDLFRSRCFWRSIAIGTWAVIVVIATIALLTATAQAAAQSPEIKAAANADRQRFDESEWGYLFYLSWDTMPVEDAAACPPVAAFTVASNSRTLVLEQHLPTPVVPGLARIDLRRLGWKWQDWHRVLARYPYAPETKLPLVVRADWLIVELWDNFESPAHYELLYGSQNIPKNRDDFLRFWGVVNNGVRDPLLLQFVEKESGVSNLLWRKIENYPTKQRSYAWGTEDTAERNFNTKTDWLENLGKETPHDAEEWIFGLNKISTTQEAGGQLNVYALIDGKTGNRQDRAPVDIVRDSREFRGLTEIRNGGSCVQCHTRGIIPLTKNALRDRIARGTELYQDRKTQELVEAQYLTEGRLKTEIIRNSEDYVTAIALITGMDPETFARSFQVVFEQHDRPLTLADCARELSMDPDEFALALGYASNRQVKLGGFLSDLPSGGVIPRPYWKSQYKIAYGAVELWRQSTQ